MSEEIKEPIEATEQEAAEKANGQEKKEPKKKVPLRQPIPALPVTPQPTPLSPQPLRPALRLRFPSSSARVRLSRSIPEPASICPAHKALPKGERI